MFEMMIGDIKEQTVKFCYNVTEQTRTERRNVIGAGKESKAEFDGSAPAKAAARICRSRLQYLTEIRARSLRPTEEQKKRSEEMTLVLADRVKNTRTAV